jgi:hypothetical protein
MPKARASTLARGPAADHPVTLALQALGDDCVAFEAARPSGPCAAAG